MKAIWKFPIELEDVQTVPLPYESEILCVQMQGDQPCLWALVDPSQKPVGREIRIFGTGHNVLHSITSDHYIGTFQMRGGSLVFHVFDTTTAAV